MWLMLGCVLEEERTDVYSIEYDCEQPHNVMFFTLNNASLSQRFLFTSTKEFGTDNPRYNENYLLIDDLGISVQSFFELNDHYYRLDMSFYRNENGNCPDIKADAVLVEAYFDESGSQRNRLYPVDCSAYTELILTHYDAVEKRVCGRFSFTVTVQNHQYTLSNGYFNLRL